MLMTKNGNVVIVYYQDPPPKVENTNISSTQIRENDHRLPKISKVKFGRFPHTPIQYTNLEGPFIFKTDIFIITPPIQQEDHSYGRYPYTKMAFKDIDGTPMTNPTGSVIVETT
jgi:hypothetical protein